MAGKCKDCRFYDGKNCAIYGPRLSSSTCSHFASYIKSQTRKCKDCRFYDGKKCGVYGAIRMPNSTCSKFSPYR